MGNSKEHTPFKRVLDKLEKKHFNFEGEGYEEDEHHDYMDGSRAGQPVKMYQADPYQIIIENKTTEPLTAIVFGHDRNLLKPRFGNPEGILVNLGQPDSEYVELLQQSASQPFITQFLRVESPNVLQLSRFITVTTKNANGNYSRRPLNMQQYKSAYQQQENILDVPINESVNGTKAWEMVIEPETRVIYTIFPSYKVDTSSTLYGNDPIKTYAQARVNTAGLQLPMHNGRQLKR